MYPSLGHHAGAEWMLHNIMRSLSNEGAEAHVYVGSAQPAQRVGRWDGVHVHVGFPSMQQTERYDVALTHLDESLNAARLCVGAGVPLAHVVHNTRQLAYHGVTQRTCQLAVFNSDWLRRSVSWPGESITCTPPVFRSDYVTERDRVIGRTTLVNLSREKGVAVFYDLAARRPDSSFMGVIGSYGGQDVRFNVENVVIRQPTPYMARDVYRKTRVLLMPSAEESYGRCAVEAAMSGIPSLVSDTEGLREALGDAGTYLDPADPAAWEAAHRALDAPRAYQAASRLALDRAADVNMDSAAMLTRLRERLSDLARRGAVV